MSESTKKTGEWRTVGFALAYKINDQWLVLGPRYQNKERAEKHVALGKLHYPNREAIVVHIGETDVCLS